MSGPDQQGWFRAERKAFDDEWLFDKPFNRGAAWFWLIKQAAHKPTTLRLAHGAVDLKAGQLTASVRYLAERWGWSKTRVERVIAAFKNRDMIDVDTGTGQMVITICSYCKNGAVFCFHFSNGGFSKNNLFFVRLNYYLLNI